jgi:hypothetical protein
MTMYLILGLLDDSEHSADVNVLMPMLNTTKVSNPNSSSLALHKRAQH